MCMINLPGRSDKYLEPYRRMTPLSQNNKFSIVSSIIVDGYYQNFSRIRLVVLFWPCEEADESAEFRKMEKDIGQRFDSCVWKGNLRQNMVLLVHTRDQVTVETVDFTQRTCSEEGEDCPIDRKGDGHRFLRFTRYDLHRLPGEGENGHRVEPCDRFTPGYWADSTPNWKKNNYLSKNKVPSSRQNWSNLRTSIKRILRKKLEQRSVKYVELKEDYVEK